MQWDIQVSDCDGGAYDGDHNLPSGSSRSRASGRDRGGLVRMPRQFASHLRRYAKATAVVAGESGPGPDHGFRGLEVVLSVPER